MKIARSIPCIRTLTGLASIAVLTIAMAAPTRAAFEWSFSNVVGGIPGTVTGLLEVPDGAGVSATSVVLTSTTNPVFNSLIGFDFATVPTFMNRFNVAGGTITASLFGTNFFANSTNLSLEFNSEVFGDANSQNLGLLTTAGNPLTGACPAGCLQTATLSGDNAGQTQFAPTFIQVSEPASAVVLVVGLAALYSRRATRNQT